MGSGAALLPQPTSPRSSRLVPSIALLLLLLAILPLSGAAFFAVRDYDRALAGQGRAEEIGVEVSRLVAYSELRTSVLAERNWALVSDGLDGVAPGVVQEFTGIDVESEQQRAVDAVDALVASMGGAASARALAELRAATLEAADRSEGYLRVEREIGAEADRLMLDVQRTAGLVSGGDDLIEALRLVEHATAARRAVTLQLSTYFAAQFSDGARGIDELRTLIAEQAMYDESIRRFEALAIDTEAAAAASVVRRSSSVVAFEQAIEDFVADALGAGVDRPARSLDRLLEEIGEIASTFESGASSAVVHGELVAAAGSEAANRSVELAGQGDRATSAALWTIGVLTVLSLAFAFALARFIARPLRRLAQAAHAVRRGAVPSGRVVRGPAEVRQVAEAVIEAGAHVALAEQQALALASGRLDDPVLSERAPGTLGASLQHAVRTLAATLQDREQSRQRLAYDAAHDGLTNLFNRNASLALLERGVEQAQAGRGDLALMFIDLDDFKSVNDRMGHAVGDHVLRTVAARLSDTVRDGDLVGRLGGDEFVVMLSLVNGAANAIAVAERLRQKITDPVPYEDDIIFRIDASIGVALTGPGDDTTAEELLRAADVAVYRAKDTGRGRIVLSDAMQGSGRAAPPTIEAPVETAVSSAVSDVDAAVESERVLSR